MIDAPPPLVAGHPLPHDLARVRAEALARLAAGAEDGAGTAEGTGAAGASGRSEAEMLAWLDALPRHVERIAGQWGLELGAPLEPGGTSAWVAQVRDADGAELLLKVAWAHEESRDEAAGMAAWQGRGAAEVLRHERVGDCAALLMERVRPGRTLSSALPEEQRDVVVAAMLRRLRIPAPAGSTFRPLAHMCAWWADAAETRAREVLPSEVAEHGLALFRRLPREWDGEPVLLATDLHHHNVLSRWERPGTDLADWALIDPKPYVGDPHYDVLQHLLNFPERLRADPDGFAARMAGLAELDLRRTRDWLFARCVQEAGSFPVAAEVALQLAGRV